MQGGRIAVHDIQSSGHCGNFLHLLPRDISRIGDNFQFLQRLRKARVGQGGEIRLVGQALGDGQPLGGGSGIVVHDCGRCQQTEMLHGIV